MKIFTCNPIIIISLNIACVIFASTYYMGYIYRNLKQGSDLLIKTLPTFIQIINYHSHASLNPELRTQNSEFY